MKRALSTTWFYLLVPLAVAIMGRAVSQTRFLAGAAVRIAMVLVWSYGLEKPWEVDGLVVGVFANLTVFFAFDRKRAPVSGEIPLAPEEEATPMEALEKSA